MRWYTCIAVTHTATFVVEADTEEEAKSMLMDAWDDDDSRISMALEDDWHPDVTTYVMGETNEEPDYR